MSSINVHTHNFMPSCSASFAPLASHISNSDIKANCMWSKYAHSIHSCQDLSWSRSVVSRKVNSLESVIWCFHFIFQYLPFSLRHPVAAYVFFLLASWPLYLFFSKVFQRAVSIQVVTNPAGLHLFCCMQDVPFFPSLYLIFLHFSHDWSNCFSLFFLQHGLTKHPAHFCSIFQSDQVSAPWQDYVHTSKAWAVFLVAQCSGVQNFCIIPLTPFLRDPTLFYRFVLLLVFLLISDS